MKRFAVCLAVAVAVAFSAGTVAAAPPDKPIPLTTEKKTKPPVHFEHMKHKDLKCAECHHKDAAGKEQKCSACHESADLGKKLAIKEAFHKNCRDCHKAVKKGPTSCADCHKPEKK